MDENKRLLLEWCDPRWGDRPVSLAIRSMLAEVERLRAEAEALRKQVAGLESQNRDLKRVAIRRIVDDNLGRLEPAMRFLKEHGD